MMEDLDNLTFPSDGNLWEEFKFADTDEDWSVSENSSDPGFYLDALGPDACSDLVPETKVQATLHNLDLLASNTNSALSLPPFVLDDRSHDNTSEMGEDRSNEWASMLAKDEPFIKDETFDTAVFNFGNGPTAAAFGVDGTMNGFGVGEDEHEYELPAPVMLPTPSSKFVPMNKGTIAPSAGLNKKRKVKDMKLPRKDIGASATIPRGNNNLNNRLAHQGSFSVNSTDDDASSCGSKVCRRDTRQHSVHMASQVKKSPLNNPMTASAFDHSKAIQIPREPQHPMHVHLRTTSDSSRHPSASFAMSNANKNAKHLKPGLVTQAAKAPAPSTVATGTTKAAPSSSSLATSKRSNNKGTENRCEFCLDKMESPEALQKHRVEHLLGPNLFKCTSAGCEKQYATGEGLRLHVRNVHLCAKNWQCLADGCSRSFVRQSDLRMHIIRMHSDIRPFPCLVDTCSKSFACHSELRRHVLSCHKLPCPKPEKIQSKTNYVDPSFIQALMKKAE